MILLILCIFEIMVLDIDSQVFHKDYNDLFILLNIHIFNQLILLIIPNLLLNNTPKHSNKASDAHISHLAVFYPK